MVPSWVGGDTNDLEASQSDGGLTGPVSSRTLLQFASGAWSAQRGWPFRDAPCLSQPVGVVHLQVDPSRGQTGYGNAECF